MTRDQGPYGLRRLALLPLKIIEHRSAREISHSETRAVIEQPLNDSSIAATGEEVQNRFAFLVLAVEVCAVIKKKLHHRDPDQPWRGSLSSGPEV